MHFRWCLGFEAASDQGGNHESKVASEAWRCTRSGRSRGGLVGEALWYGPPFSPPSLSGTAVSSSSPRPVPHPLAERRSHPRNFPRGLHLCRSSYFNPHSLRKTLALFGQQVCKSREEYKAWSQNLGHEGVLTTFLNYGAVSTGRQSEIMRQLASPKEDRSRAAGESLEAKIRHLLDANSA